MLAQVLGHLSELQNGHHPDLLVGLAAPDDATVYRINDEQAVVLTVDFFAPLVDDPTITARSRRRTPSATFTRWAPTRCWR